MILHIPHSSSVIPGDIRDQFVLSDDELLAELILMTDWFTDDLFASAGATTLTFPVSRLVVDVERFPVDSEEPMSKVGMGMIYTRTASGAQLRRALEPREKAGLVALYESHHQVLAQEVSSELASLGRALVVDCHSFPGHPLPCDNDQSVPRPDFCIGTDPFHTPKALVESIALQLTAMGYSVQLDRPYSGALVPLEFLGKDRRVASVMVEINRGLYMDEASGVKAGAFDSVKEQMRSILATLAY